MSEHINALILIGHNTRMAADVPSYTREDAGQGLWYIREGKQQWYNGQPITETERVNIYASEVFLDLGRIAASTYLREPVSFIGDANIFKSSVIDAINEISPIGGELLRYPVDTSYGCTVTTENGLPRMYQKALLQDPSMKDELLAKWSIAGEIHANRGGVILPSYNTDEMMNGLSNLNMHEIAPDDISDSSHSLAGLIDHIEIETYLASYPYYSTLDEKENGVEMLDSALEDLRLVEQAIR